MAAPASRKVKGASGSAGLAGAVVTVALWLVGTTDTDVPPEVAAALTTLVSALFAFIGGYFTREA